MHRRRRLGAVGDWPRADLRHARAPGHGSLSRSRSRHWLPPSGRASRGGVEGSHGPAASGSSWRGLLHPQLY